MVEEVMAVRTELADVLQVIERGQIPVVVDPQGQVVSRYKALAVVDAILAKKNN